jgi:hypothetical protein
LLDPPTFTLIHVAISVVGILAPTQQEAPFAATQVALLMSFAWLGVAALRGFRS